MATVSKISRTLDFREKAKLAHKVISIKCNICKRLTFVHLYSHCHSKKLCITCANCEESEGFKCM